MAEKSSLGSKAHSVLLYIVAAFPVMALNSLAANYEFTGEVDNKWGTPGNWRTENGGKTQTKVPSIG